MPIIPASKLEVPLLSELLPESHIELLSDREFAYYSELHHASWSVAVEVGNEYIPDNPHHGPVHFAHVMEGARILGPIAQSTGAITLKDFCLLPAIMGLHDAGFSDSRRLDEQGNFTDANERVAVGIAMKLMSKYAIFGPYSKARVEGGILSTVVCGVDEQGVVQSGSVIKPNMDSLAMLVNDIDLCWNGMPADVALPQVSSLFLEQYGEQPELDNENFRKFLKFASSVMKNHKYNFDGTTDMYSQNYTNARKIEDILKCAN